MTGEIDQMSHAVGQLDGTVQTLVAQQEALFRKIGETNGKVDALTTSVAEHTASQLAALSAVDTKTEVIGKHLSEDVDPHIEEFKTFATRADEEAKQRTKQRNILFGAVPVVGVALNQIIEFFKSLGPS